jgi:hypothetical protein
MGRSPSCPRRPEGIDRNHVDRQSLLDPTAVPARCHHDRQDPNVRRYRTEIVVPFDRYVCLQLPEPFPTGPAVVTVMIHDPLLGGEPADRDLTDPDREDIEWWEEFEEDAGSVE